MFRHTKSFASFTTFAPFWLLSETTMSYVFHNGLLLLLMDKLVTAPSKLLMPAKKLRYNGTVVNSNPLTHCNSCSMNYDFDFKTFDQKSETRGPWITCGREDRFCCPLCLL